MLAWVVSLIAVFFLGFHIKDIWIRITVLEKQVKTKIDKKSEPEEAKSEIIDPTDEVQTAIYEAKRMQDKLNEIK